MWGSLVAAAVVVVVVGEATHAVDLSAAVLLADAAAGVTFLAAGLVALRSGRRSRRLGATAYVAGVAWFAGNVLSAAAPLHRPLMIHAVLSYPHGRLSSRVSVVAVVTAWAALVLPDGARPIAALLIALLLLAEAARSAVRSSMAHRLSAGVRARAAVFIAFAVAVPAGTRVASRIGSDADVLATTYAVLIAASGLVLMVSVAFRVGTAADLADVVIELTETGPPGMETILAGLGTDQSHGVSSDTVAAPVLATVAGHLETNQLLHDTLRGQVDEVRKSRLRLVQAADVERQRLARRLAEGPGSHLAELDETLIPLTTTADDDIAAMATRARRELTATRDELDQLAQGLHPRLLVEGGLRVALTDLAERHPVTTAVEVPDSRFPGLAESTVWFVCAEAAANVAKHSNADLMTINVAVYGGDLVVTVCDDGVGLPARVAAGGLTGLADRVEAVGGAFEVSAAARGGTCVRATVPIT